MEFRQRFKSSLGEKSSQLHDAVECDDDYLLPNGESMRMQLIGSSEFMTGVNG